MVEAKSKVDAAAKATDAVMELTKQTAHILREGTMGESCSMVTVYLPTIASGEMSS